MRALELKIPPPAVTALTASGMWGISLVSPLLQAPAALRVTVALALALAGAGISLAGVLAFRRARTTVNPMRPGKTSSLVTSGIYARTRNPMYAGLLVALAGWAAWLAAPLALAGPVAFVLYIGRFQIVPEERVLAEKFAGEFAAYKAKVRRWL